MDGWNDACLMGGSGGHRRVIEACVDLEAHFGGPSRDVRARANNIPFWVYNVFNGRFVCCWWCRSCFFLEIVCSFISFAIENKNKISTLLVDQKKIV